MDRSISAEQSEKASIAELVRVALAVEPITIERMEFGHTHHTYTVQLPKQAVIVRTSIKSTAFATTRHNLETLKSRQLPVPTVLTSDLSREHYPFAYMILEKIPGRDLVYELASMTCDQMCALAKQLVAYQKHVGKLPYGTGYGYVGIGETGPMKSWVEFLRQCNEVKQTANLAEPWNALIAEALQWHEPYLMMVKATCFLDDITVKNVIVQNGELQGLIDFDCVCYGDPLWWIGLTAAGVASDVGSEALFYVDELCRCYGLTDVQRRIVSLYCAIHAVAFVSRSDGRESPEWSIRMRRHIERWFAEALTVG